MCSLYLGNDLISGNKPINLGVRNIGEVVASAIPLTDAGLHLLDGSLIQGGGIYQGFVDYIANIVSTYPDVFTTESAWQSSVSTYGSCGKFVYDSVNNTVRLPKVSDILQGTTDVTALGNLVEAGLPNITGSAHFNIEIDGSNNFIDSASGAFTRSSATTNYRNFNGGVANSDNFRTLNLDASSSSSIYGNSSTVQPQAIKVLYYIVIANSTKTEIQSDIDEVVTDLNGKADTDLTNTTNTGYIKMAGASMPSNKYINLTLGASGSTYTAPANGYYFIDKIGNSGQYLDLGVYDANTENLLYEVSLNSSASAVNLRTTIPILKNNVLKIWYNVSGSTVRFRFIYAKGSESEAS